MAAADSPYSEQPPIVFPDSCFVSSEDSIHIYEKPPAIFDADAFPASACRTGQGSTSPPPYSPSESSGSSINQDDLFVGAGTGEAARVQMDVSGYESSDLSDLQSECGEAMETDVEGEDKLMARSHKESGLPTPPSTSSPASIPSSEPKEPAAKRRKVVSEPRKEVSNRKDKGKGKEKVKEGKVKEEDTAGVKEKGKAKESAKTKESEGPDEMEKKGKVWLTSGLYSMEFKVGGTLPADLPDPRLIEKGIIQAPWADDSRRKRLSLAPNVNLPNPNQNHHLATIGLEPVAVSVKVLHSTPIPVAGPSSLPRPSSFAQGGNGKKRKTSGKSSEAGEKRRAEKLLPLPHGYGLKTLMEANCGEEPRDFKLPPFIWEEVDGTGGIRKKVQEVEDRNRKPDPWSRIYSNIYVDRKPDKTDVHAICHCRPPRGSTSKILTPTPTSLAEDSATGSGSGPDSGSNAPSKRERRSVGFRTASPSAEGTSPEEVGCGENCINRMMYYLCDPKTCPCGDLCSNLPLGMRRGIGEVGRKIKSKSKNKASRPSSSEGNGASDENDVEETAQEGGLTLFWTGSRGFGLKTTVPIKEGEFIIEYTGEVISRDESYRRVLDQYKGKKNFYFLDYDGWEVLDAGMKGSIARFANHSCCPNTRVVRYKLSAVEEYQIGIFAKRDIEAGEELTYDYGWQDFGDSTNSAPKATRSTLKAAEAHAAEAEKAKQRCMCGAAGCKGWLGSRKEKV